MNIVKRNLRTASVGIAALSFSTVGLVSVGATAASAAPSVSSSGTAAVVPAAARSKGALLVKVKGKRFGKKAKVVVKGLDGSSYRKKFKVKKTRTLNLRSGRYKVVGKPIKSGGNKAKATGSRKVSVTTDSRATAKIKYQSVGASGLRGAQGPSNLSVVQLGSPGTVKASWDAPPKGEVKTYRGYYSTASGSGPWTKQDPPFDYSATSASYNVCSLLDPGYRVKGWGYITAVFKSGAESGPSNVVYFDMTCPS